MSSAVEAPFIAAQVSAGPVFEPRRRSTAGTAAFGAGAPPQGQAPAYAAPSQPTSPYGQAPGNPPFLPQGPAKPAAPPAKPVAPEPPAQPTGPPANVTIDTVDTSQVRLCTWDPGRRSSPCMGCGVCRGVPAVYVM